ncbi:hypothetical protein [Streptomyces parvus]|uniref:hypothetical protein n=1 Tax=Streptomyces parvus TaxID=66428 RepID=UPI00371A0E13
MRVHLQDVKPQRPDHAQPKTRRAARRAAVPADPVPAVLPNVVIAVADTGEVTVTIDDAPYAPEPFAPAWRREDFARLIDQITDQRHSAIRVEVRESDGTVFTDIIAPARRHTPEAAPDPQPASTPTAEFVEFRGAGFVPGEDVAVAVVITHTDARHDGTARSLLDSVQLDTSPSREVILLGRISGTLEIGRPR